MQRILLILIFPSVIACAPAVTRIEPAEGRPGTIVSLSMKHLVGWPRIEIAGHTFDYYELKLLGARSGRENVSDMDLVWIEDKILQFRVPNLLPGEYRVVVYDDKGPPGDPIYSFLETGAYVVFPPVWPFVLRSNETSFVFRVTE